MQRVRKIQRNIWSWVWNILLPYEYNSWNLLPAIRFVRPSFPWPCFVAISKYKLLMQQRPSTRTGATKTKALWFTTTKLQHDAHSNNFYVRINTNHTKISHNNQQQQSRCNLKKTTTIPMTTSYGPRTHIKTTTRRDRRRKL